MLLLTLMMMFIVVMMDVNKVAMNKLILDITVDNTALSFGSMIASEAKVLSATRLAGGAHRTVMLSDQGVLTQILGILLIVVILVVYLIICIVTEGAALSAAPGIAVLIGAIIGGLIALGTWLIGEYSRQQAVIGQWTEAISTFPNKSARYRENLVSMVLPIMAMDREVVRDIHDFNQNSRVSDELSRFMYLYSHRLNKMLQSDSASQAKLALNCGQSSENSENIPKAMLAITDSLEALADADISGSVNFPLSPDDVYDDRGRASNPRLNKGVLDLAVLRDLLAEGVDAHYIKEELINEDSDLKAQALNDYRYDLCGNGNPADPCEDDTIKDMDVKAATFTIEESAITDCSSNSLVCQVLVKTKGEPSQDATDANYIQDNAEWLVAHDSWEKDLARTKKELVYSYNQIKSIMTSKFTHDRYLAYKYFFSVDGYKKDFVLSPEWYYARGLNSVYEELYTTGSTIYLSDPLGTEKHITDMGAAFKLMYYLYDKNRSIGTFKILDRWFARDLAFMRELNSEQSYFPSKQYPDWMTNWGIINFWFNWPYKCAEYIQSKSTLEQLENELKARPNPSKKDILMSDFYATLFTNQIGKTISPITNSHRLNTVAKVNNAFKKLWFNLFDEVANSQTDDVSAKGLLNKFREELMLQPYPSDKYFYRDVYRDYGEANKDFDIYSFGIVKETDPYGYCDHETEICEPKDVMEIFGANERYLAQHSPYLYYSLEDGYGTKQHSTDNEAAYEAGTLNRLVLWNSAHDNAARGEYEACASDPENDLCKDLYTLEGIVDELQGDDLYSKERSRFGKKLMNLAGAPRETSVLPEMFESLRKVRAYIKKVTFKGAPIAASSVDKWELVKLTETEVNQVCNGNACDNPDNMMANKYFLMPLTTPRKSMRTMTGINGMLQNYFEVEGETIDNKAGGPLLQFPNAYKMEAVMNQFNKNYQHFENFVPIQEFSETKPTNPGDPKIKILKSTTNADPEDPNYYGNPYEFNFFIPPYSSSTDYKPTELRHNPNNLQLVRQLWVMENLLVNVIWEQVVALESKLLAFKAKLDAIVVDDADTYMQELKARFIYKKLTFPLRNLEDIKKKITHFCYIPVGKNKNMALDVNNLAEIRTFNDNVAKIWNSASFTSATKPLPSLQIVRQNLETALESMTKIRGFEGDFMSDAGEAAYVWRDGAEDGGKWHVAYIFSDEDIPYPYVEARQDQKFTYTLGYSWMRPFCNPEFDCVGGGSGTTVFNTDQCSGSGDRIQGIKDGDDKNWNCTTSKSVWVKAARFDEPDMFLGWPMFSSLKDKKKWRKLKKELIEYMQAKADQMYLNEIDILSYEYFDIPVEMVEKINTDGTKEMVPKPTAAEMALIKKRKQEMHESLATGQILFSSSDANIFTPLRAFLVENGIWSRSQVTIKPTKVKVTDNEEGGASGEDWVGLFLFGIPPLSTNAEWEDELVDWDIEITATGSDCGDDEMGRCDPNKTSNNPLLEKFKLIKDALNSKANDG